jgi:hypothetical protein
MSTKTRKTVKRITSAKVEIKGDVGAYWWAARVSRGMCRLSGPDDVTTCATPSKAEAHARRNLARLGITEVSFTEA